MSFLQFLLMLFVMIVLPFVFILIWIIRLIHVIRQWFGYTTSKRVLHVIMIVITFFICAFLAFISLSAISGFYHTVTTSEEVLIGTNINK